MMKRMGVLGLMWLCTGCYSQWDMHGHDPKEYYAAHPIRNEVEMRHLLHTLPLSADKEAQTGLREAVQDISAASVESVRIGLHASQMGNEEKKKALTRIFTGMGYPRSAVVFHSSREVKSSAAQIDITYAAVISPRCPDWRTSGVTNYSNTQYGNFGCATATNLGLQVADPRDLVKGRGDVTPDTERSLRVIREYRGGESSGSSGGGASSGGGDMGDLGTAPAPPQ